jgi:hypothetical protein
LPDAPLDRAAASDCGKKFTMFPAPLTLRRGMTRHAEALAKADGVADEIGSPGGRTRTSRDRKNRNRGRRIRSRRPHDDAILIRRSVREANHFAPDSLDSDRFSISGRRKMTLL